MKNKIFIFIFFLISILPLALMFVPNDKTQLANEVLAEPPVLVVDGNLNVNYPSQFSDYFDDNFGLRRQMIAVHNKLVATVFGESAEKKVILGKDGWLFYEETLDDYQSTNRFTDQEIKNICTTLSLMQEYCNQNNMKFVFTVAPNKNSLYGEKMPGYYMRDQENSNGERLSKALEESDVVYVNLFDAFRQQDKILYRKTDSHWTQEGAGLAADQIVEALQMEVEPFYGGATREETAPAGDLFEMLYLSKKDNDVDVLYERASTFQYQRPIRSVEDIYIKTTSPAEDGKLFMFRDSFGNNLHLLMAEQFASATFSRVNPYQLTRAKLENADTVVVEIVERNLDWLLSRPPVFPAPERMLKADALTKVAGTEVSAVASEEMTGYHKIQGKLPEGVFYDKIYFAGNEILYEATPCADGFVGFIPSDQVPDAINVYIEKN